MNLDYNTFIRFMEELMAKQYKNKNERKKTNNRQPYKTSYKTHDGHRLTVLEAKFIDLYIECGKVSQAVTDAGYKTKTPNHYGQLLLEKEYIANEINYRLEQYENSKIASATEILQYYTSVMRGEVSDQFGLEAPLAERTKAATELAKRTIDIANKVNGKQDAKNKQIKLVIERRK